MAADPGVVEDEEVDMGCPAEGGGSFTLSPVPPRRDSSGVKANPVATSDPSEGEEALRTRSTPTASSSADEE